MEEKTIRIIKSIPVNHRLQLGIKVAIPFILSSISLIISLFVLLVTGVISFVTFLFALLFSFILLFIFCMVSLIEELNIRNNKAKQTTLSTIVSYVVPILFFVISVLLAYVKVPYVLVNLIGLVLLLGVAGLIVWYLIKNLDRKFMELDVIN